jgi:7-carboxy-7-deazaguanine synthase
VYLTGGEPLVQKDLRELVMKLRQKDYSITIATNGTLPRPSWWRHTTWDIDYKCPSSGVNMFSSSWTVVGKKNRIKFVVADETDLECAAKHIRELRNPLNPTLIISPMIPLMQEDLTSGRAWLQRVWNFCCENNLRYSLQVHKVTFGNKKGV